MKYAILEIPFTSRLAIPVDALGALQHSALVTVEGYGDARNYTVADPKEKIEIVVVDEREIESYAKPTTEPTEPVEPIRPAPTTVINNPSDDDSLSF